ncbi:MULTISPECIES: ion transporter [Pseudovibrio]|uniref:ion transporter n=1 Tax=Stappiaceae TaxID=2821832 RepID=UPI0023667F9C|nr:MULTISPECIES: ion transporter [Pseudovibrio]MDD7911146.1 ion transporter [Pseudovibrio exalbescens]MDX5593166.1 ion transporter [Pseudovibrio sp. SPO723]
MRARLRALIEGKRWEYTIVTLILINAVTLGLETSQTAMDAFGPVLIAMDRTILAIFVVELTLRIFAYGPRFFTGAWNLFDTFIIGIALVPATGPASVLRALRILRVLRLISVVPSLRKVIGGLMAALPGMGSVVLLMTLVFYVFSVMATKLYGASFPDWFGSIAASAYTLFQVMTLESWSMGIVRPVMEVYPSAWLFFLPFILCTAFTVLNLFIGIMVSAMQQEHDASAEKDRQLIHSETELVLQEVRALRREVAELRNQSSEKT